MAVGLQVGANLMAPAGLQVYFQISVIDEVFNPLGGNLIIVKDQDGKFYLRNNNYNNIPEFIPGRGYQVKVNEETVLDFSSL